MASLAERLPVCLIPEQPLVAPMWNDVIHHCCRDNLALRLAEGAQRMLLQEKSAGLTPAGIVPTGIRSAPSGSVRRKTDQRMPIGQIEIQPAAAAHIDKADHLPIFPAAGNGRDPVGQSADQLRPVMQRLFV